MYTCVKSVSGCQLAILCLGSLLNKLKRVLLFSVRVEFIWLFFVIRLKKKIGLICRWMGLRWSWWCNDDSQWFQLRSVLGGILGFLFTLFIYMIMLVQRLGGRMGLNSWTLKNGCDPLFLAPYQTQLFFWNWETEYDLDKFSIYFFLNLINIPIARDLYKLLLYAEYLTLF